MENQEVVDVFAGLKEPDHIIKVGMGLESTFPLFLVHWGNLREADEGNLNPSTGGWGEQWRCVG